ncbi:hypothetical protein GWI33_009515, partial [Rhynchophorus ferrugineus]
TSSHRDVTYPFPGHDKVRTCAFVPFCPSTDYKQGVATNGAMGLEKWPLFLTVLMSNVALRQALPQGVAVISSNDDTTSENAISKSNDETTLGDSVSSYNLDVDIQETDFYVR